MIDFDMLQATLEKVVGAYEKTAPTVSDWANDLFIRISEDMDSIRLVEIMMAGRIYNEREGFMGPHEAANQVFKLMHRMGQDTKGHFGF
jgi:hypothetical protein